MRIKSLLFSVSVGAAAGVAFYFFNKTRRSENAPRASKKSGRANAASGTKGSSPTAQNNLKAGSYSFISGFKDAVTVDLSFSYDAGRFSFKVVEDEFLVESGDSHVGVLSGENFNAQLEYAAYYSGEDFEKLRTELAAHHGDLTDVVFGVQRGLRFTSGDGLCFAFPIPDDTHSYLLLTLFKAPGNDDELIALADDPDLLSILSSMRFSRT